MMEVNGPLVRRQEFRSEQEVNRLELRSLATAEERMGLRCCKQEDCIQLVVRILEPQDKREESTLELRNLEENKELLYEQEREGCKEVDCKKEDCRMEGCKQVDYVQVGCRLGDCRVEGCKKEDCRMEQRKKVDCRMEDCKKVDCKMEDCRLGDCRLEDYRLEDYRLEGCILRNCKPVDCKMNLVGYNELELCSLALVLHTGL